eukprot:SAG31_NODE_191_length_20809_cov_64.613761_3_plen_47_part_00
MFVLLYHICRLEWLLVVNTVVASTNVMCVLPNYIVYGLILLRSASN